MREFRTINEFLEYRKTCPICGNNLFIKDFNKVDNYLLLKADYKSDTYIFNISTTSLRIHYSIPNLSKSSGKRISSINPLRLTLLCPKPYKGNHNANGGVEYNVNIDIIHTTKKQESLITKIALVSENFVFVEEKKLYSIEINYKNKNTETKIIELNSKTFGSAIVKYNIIDKNKIYKQEYVLNKLRTILLLR